MIGKFNKEVAAKLISYAHKGCPDSGAAKLAGIHPNTLKRWLAEGERGNPEYEEFYLNYQKAVATSELDAIDFVREAGDVKAVQWFLSTRFRNTWGNQIKVDATVEVKTEILEEILNLLEEKLEPDLFNKVVEVLADDKSN